MKCSIKTATDGGGLWSETAKKVSITKIEMETSDCEFGELQAFFSKKDWNTEKHGLIYTDDQWIKDFRKGLIKMGFSKKAADDVDYSEQGMQGNDYVSLDIGRKFIIEYVAMDADLDPKNTEKVITALSDYNLFNY
jgi:hypothetical protein